MTQGSIPEKAPASSPTSLDLLMDRIELELHRLRDKRPHLGDRIDRASTLLVTHFACPPRTRLIRVRLRNGHARFLVRGSGGTVYSVDAKSWQCSCPDAHRRGRGCKHALAAYILRRAAQPAPTPAPRCDSCEHQFPRGELVEVQAEHGNLTYFPGDLLCSGCADRGGVPR